MFRMGSPIRLPWFAGIQEASKFVWGRRRLTVIIAPMRRRRPCAACRTRLPAVDFSPDLPRAWPTWMVSQDIFLLCYPLPAKTRPDVSPREASSQPTAMPAQAEDGLEAARAARGDRTDDRAQRPLLDLWHRRAAVPGRMVAGHFLRYGPYPNPQTTSAGAPMATSMSDHARARQPTCTSRLATPPAALSGAARQECALGSPLMAKVVRDVSLPLVPFLLGIFAKWMRNRRARVDWSSGAGQAWRITAKASVRARAGTNTGRGRGSTQPADGP